MKKSKFGQFALLISVMFALGLVFTGASVTFGARGGSRGSGGGGRHYSPSAGRQGPSMGSRSHPGGSQNRSPQRVRTPSQPSQPTGPAYRPSAPTSPGQPGHGRPSTVPAQPAKPSQKPTAPGTKPGSSHPTTKPNVPSSPGQPGHGKPSTLPARPARPSQKPGVPGVPGHPGTKPGVPGRPEHRPGQPPMIRPGHGAGEHGSDYVRQAERHYHHPRHEHGYYYYNDRRFHAGLHFGYWAFNNQSCTYPYCYSSPFYYYGLPYVYGPSVTVVTVPQYTYSSPPPNYSYTGINAALDDIKNAWLSGSADRLRLHIDSSSQVAIYLDGSYTYSVDGLAYKNMMSDTVSNVRTSDFNFYRVEMRSDGAYTAYGKQDMYDIDGNRRTIYVSYTLSQIGGRWIIVAAGSSENQLG